MATKIEIAKLFPLSFSAGCQIVRVTKNVLGIAPVLGRTGLNLVIAIICALQKCLLYQNLGDLGMVTEQRLEIPMDYITRRHITDIASSLLYLMDLALVFSFSIPGYSSSGITRLISGVKNEKGKVIVTVPGDAIPWLIYCGKAVGFVIIEKKVFFGLRNLPEQMLYLFLLSRIDPSLKINVVKIPVDTIHSILGIKSTRPVGSVLQKYIKVFPNHLAALHSTFSVTTCFEREKATSGSRGPRPLSTITFSIRNEKIGGPKEKDLLEEAVQKAVILLKKYATQKRDVSIPWLIDEIEKKGRKDEFISVMERISKQNENKKNFVRVANTVAKVLRDDFNITV